MNIPKSNQPRKSFYLTPIILLVLALIDMQRNQPSNVISPDSNVFSEEVLVGETIQLGDIAGYLVLVNEENPLSSEYEPQDLRLVQIFDENNNPNSTIYLRERAASMVEQMFKEAEILDIILLGKVGYRSYEAQEKLYSLDVEQHGQEQTTHTRPGFSEHQTGLALDLTGYSDEEQRNIDFLETTEGMWIRENAHRFGFIIRYLEDQESWHLRYVGINTATIIYQNNWTFEEYLDKN